MTNEDRQELLEILQMFKQNLARFDQLDEELRQDLASREKKDDNFSESKT